MTDSASILFASASEGNVEVMADFLRSEGYNPVEAVTLDDLDTVIHQKSVDIALIDADGFAPEVWSRCERLQKQGVPFFVVSQHGEVASQKGQRHNAVRVFEKPLGQDAVLRTIDQLLDG